MLMDASSASAAHQIQMLNGRSRRRTLFYLFIVLVLLYLYYHFYLGASRIASRHGSIKPKMADESLTYTFVDARTNKKYTGQRFNSSLLTYLDDFKLLSAQIDQEVDDQT